MLCSTTSKSLSKSYCLTLPLNRAFKIVNHTTFNWRSGGERFSQARLQCFGCLTSWWSYRSHSWSSLTMAKTLPGGALLHLGMSVSVTSFGLLSDVGSRCSFSIRDLVFCWLVGFLFQVFFWELRFKKDFLNLRIRFETSLGMTSWCYSDTLAEIQLYYSTRMLI